MRRVSALRLAVLGAALLLATLASRGPSLGPLRGAPGLGTGGLVEGCTLESSYGWEDAGYLPQTVLVCWDWGGTLQIPSPERTR